MADPELIFSDLSREVTREGVTVQVEIYRIETDRRWVLEVANEDGARTVWDDLFETDRDALEAFEFVLAEEGIGSFLDGGDAETVH